MWLQFSFLIITPVQGGVTVAVTWVALTQTVVSFIAVEQNIGLCRSVNRSLLFYLFNFILDCVELTMVIHGELSGEAS